MELESQRKQFEELSYLKYLTSETEARAKFPNQEFRESMKQAQFCKRDEHGKYELIGLDAAWWGWKAHNEAMLIDSSVMPEPVRVVLGAFIDVCKVCANFDNEPRSDYENIGTFIRAITATVDNPTIVAALKALRRV